MKDLKIISTAQDKVLSLFPPSTQKSLHAINSLLHSIVHSNAELSTLLSIGMLLQIMAFNLLPRLLAITPAIVFLIAKILYANPKTVADNWYLRKSKPGRYSAHIPNEDGSMPEKPGSNGVVTFILGTQVNQ